MMRSCIGKLIGRVNSSIFPSKTCLSRNRYPVGSFNSLSSFQIAKFSEYPRSKHYEMGDKAKAGLVSNPSTLTTEKVVKRHLDKGDTVNMADLLFTSNRDYLVKYNNQQVKAKHLESKVIALLFLPLCLDHHFARWATMLLTEVYSNLPSNNGFEVVFVAINDTDHGYFLPKDPHKLFLDMLSSMPWAAIPFSDIPTVEYLHTRFGFCDSIGYDYQIVIVDSRSVILQYWDSVEIIELYGALGYPFSDERIKYLESEFSAVAMQPSLNSILASPQRDYVISNKGEKVPIHTLEDNVVAIFFYEETVTRNSSVERLKVAYKELAKNKEKFEVVLVYLTDTEATFKRTDEESFWKKFKTMPWLAVPFKDPIHKKLKRIFEYLPNEDIEPYYPPDVVIFGPHGEFVEPFGDIILGNYGISAYPFTRAKAAKLEAEKVKDLKLELLWDTSTVFRRKDGSSQVRFSQLLGKRVLIFLGSYVGCAQEIDFLKKLKGAYLQTKGTHNEFEVIHVFERKIESARSKDIVGDVPWLVSPASELLPGYFGSYTGIKDKFEPSILAFDRDGKLVRKTILPTFEIPKFPFCTYDIEEEALAQISFRLMLNYWDYYKYGGQIYSARDKRLHGSWW